MFSNDRSLMRAQESAFKQSGNAINTRHADIGRGQRHSKKDNLLMEIAVLRQFIVTGPSIGQKIKPFLNKTINERDKTRSGDIRNGHSHSTNPFWRINFYCDSNYFFPLATVPFFAANNSAANIYLIDLNSDGKFVTARAQHSVPKFVQTCPNSLVTSQSESSFQPKRASAALLADQKPHSRKSSSQWQPCAVKGSYDTYRDLTSIIPAMKVTSTVGQPRLGFSLRNEHIQSLQGNGISQDSGTFHPSGKHSRNSWYVAGNLFLHQDENARLYQKILYVKFICFMLIN